MVVLAKKNVKNKSRGKWLTWESGTTTWSSESGSLITESTDGTVLILVSGLGESRPGELVDYWKGEY